MITAVYPGSFDPATYGHLDIIMAQTNRVLAPDVDTVFLTTSLEYAYLSSTIMKEVANFGGDLSKFAPREITDAVEEKLKKRETEK